MVSTVNVEAPPLISTIDGLLGVLLGEAFRNLSNLGEHLPLALGDYLLRIFLPPLDRTIFLISGFLPCAIFDSLVASLMFRVISFGIYSLTYEVFLIDVL